MEIDFSDQIKEKESKAVVEQDPCVQYSCAISNLLREKTADHNKDYQECKVKFDQLKKVFVKRYNRNPPIVFPNININVPNHLPNIKPIIKVGNNIGHNKKFKKIVIIKKIIVRKKILLSLYFSIASLFSFINS